MAPTDRYSLADVEALMAHARSAVLDHIKLLRLVFTTRQETRASSANYFVQHPALPLPLDGATPIDSIDEPLEGEASIEMEPATAALTVAAATSMAARATEGVSNETALEVKDERWVEPSDDGLPPPPPGDDVSASIGRYISSYLAQMQAAMEAKQAAREEELKQRIAEIEKKSRGGR